MLIRHVDQRVREHADQPFMAMAIYLEPHHQNHVDDYPPPGGYRECYAGRWVPPDLAALPSQAQSSVFKPRARTHAQRDHPSTPWRLL